MQTAETAAQQLQFAGADGDGAGKQLALPRRRCPSAHTRRRQAAGAVWADAAPCARRVCRRVWYRSGRPIRASGAGVLCGPRQLERRACAIVPPLRTTVFQHLSAASAPHPCQRAVQRWVETHSHALSATSVGGTEGSSAWVLATPWQKGLGGAGIHLTRWEAGDCANAHA
jgi:hypothetical protein